MALTRPLDDEPRIELARNDCWDDLVERNADGLDLGCEELQSQVGRSEWAGYGDSCLADLRLTELARGDDHRPVALAHRTAAGHQGVIVLQVGIRVERDRGDVIKGFADRPLVQGFNVGEGVGELVAWDTNLVGREPVEHKRVVGVRAVGNADLLSRGGGGGDVLRILGRLLQ